MNSFIQHYSQQEANGTFTHYALTTDGSLYVRHGMSGSDNVKADNVPYERSYANVAITLKRAKAVA